MATSREDAARKAQQELDKQQKLRHDEKAWKKQMGKVNAAHDEYRSTWNRGR